MTRFFYILLLVPIASIAQQLQQTEVRKITDMTSLTSNTIKFHKVDSSLYYLSFIDSLKIDSTYIIKINWGGWGNEVKHTFRIVRTRDGYVASLQKTAQIKGVWSSNIYPNALLKSYQVDSLRIFEKELIILLKRDDYCQDSGTSFDLTISGKSKSFVDNICKFGDAGAYLEKLLFTTDKKKLNLSL